MEMISDVEAQEILGSRDLIAIGARADDVRRQLHGVKTTFVRVFELQIEAPATGLPPRTSAGEIRIVGQPASLDAALAVVRAASSLAPGVPLTGFALSDLLTLSATTSLTETCRALRAVGLDAIAEVAIDLLDEPETVIREVRDAGLSVNRLVANVLDPGVRISLVNRARDLQSAVGGIQAFAPLPRRMSVTTPSTGYDDVKQIALARLVADNIPCIQVDWALYGPKLAQFALTIGADDVDNVSAVDPGTLGTRRSPLEEIRGNIRSAALEPVERNARFEAIG